MRVLRARRPGLPHALASRAVPRARAGRAQLITTLDGSEYVTPEQLEKELRDEIVVAGGRCKITDVQPQLNVDLGHVQRQLENVLADDPTISYFDGEVITQEYMDGVAEEINQLLQEAGSLRVTELAARFNVSTQFLTENLKRRIGSLVQGRLDASMLYTNTYLERQEACIRGALSGLTRPMAVRAWAGGGLRMRACPRASACVRGYWCVQRVHAAVTAARPFAYPLACVYAHTLSPSHPPSLSFSPSLPLAARPSPSLPISLPPSVPAHCLSPTPPPPLSIFPALSGIRTGMATGGRTAGRLPVR